MSTLHKMTKTQVKAYVKKYGSWFGVVCASNMYPTVQTMMPLDLVWNDDRGVCVKDQITCEHNPTPDDPYNYDHLPRTFDNWLNNWSYYNTSSEEGYYAHFYMIK